MRLVLLLLLISAMEEEEMVVGAVAGLDVEETQEVVGLEEVGLEGDQVEDLDQDPVDMDQDLVAVDSQAVVTVVDMDQDLVDVDHRAVAVLVTVDPYPRYWALVADLEGGNQKTTETEDKESFYTQAMIEIWNTICINIWKIVDWVLVL
eukprot:GFUD01101033.1.p1 GENE.GFUD01101033.1~~GFUD01101033.1.p1  ORF type:complete len:149 (+),score=42.66 GFUD01101033.1:70-516(+)